MPLIPYAKQTFTSDEIKAVDQVMQSDQITRGAMTLEFEKVFAKTTDAQFCVTFNSASNALMASFEAIGVDRFCTILTTPITYVASCSYALKKGAKLQLVDCLPNGCIDLEKAKKMCSEIDGRIIFVPMHYAGCILDLGSFLKGLNRNIEIVEDACHAVGGKYLDKNMVGSCEYSDLTCFSFHPAKVITTGEGGCVTTNNPVFYKKLLQIRNNGIERMDRFEYDCVGLSSNYHMTEIQAAIGLVQLKKLESFLQKRASVVKWYSKHLANVEHLTLLDHHDSSGSGLHLYVVCIDFSQLNIDRKSFQQLLLEQNIQTQVHYKPLYLLSAVQKHIHFSELDTQNAHQFYEKVLTLPLFPTLTEKQVIKIANHVKKLINLHAIQSTSLKN